MSFTPITTEKYIKLHLKNNPDENEKQLRNTDDNYEIVEAAKKQENWKGCRHIDDIDPTKIAGFFSDDGYEINPHSIPTAGLGNQIYFFLRYKIIISISFGNEPEKRTGRRC